MAGRIVNAVMVVAGKVIAVVVRGAAEAQFGDAGELAGDMLADTIGEQIAKHLFGWMGGVPKPQAAAELENFANLDDATFARQVEGFVGADLGADYDDRDRQIVRSYLTAMQAEMRAGLARSGFGQIHLHGRAATGQRGRSAAPASFHAASVHDAA